MRRHQLNVQPLCIMCMDLGRYVKADVADHIIPHRGLAKLFFNADNLQSLCKMHHDRHKQKDERRGYSVRIGQDGWPVDEQHPVHTAQAVKPHHLYPFIPPGIPELDVPSEFVCGPPASGKTHYADSQREIAGVMVLDPDEDAHLSGLKSPSDGDKVWGRNVAARHLRVLRNLTEDVEKVIIVRVCPLPQARDAWARALGGQCKIRLMDTPERVCIERIESDPVREPWKRRQIAAVRFWFACHAKGMAWNPAKELGRAGGGFRV